MRSQGGSEVIAIPKHILKGMVKHATDDAPVEACGLLVGARGKVTRCYRMTNVDASPEHFSLDAAEHFAVVKEIRPEGWEVLAVYHSHPATPARMSEEDLRLAFSPEMKYVIVSLMNTSSPPDKGGQGGLSVAPQVKCFTVQNGLAIEEPVLTEES